MSVLPGVEMADWEKSRSKGCAEGAGGTELGTAGGTESIVVSAGVELRWRCCSVTANDSKGKIKIKARTNANKIKACTNANSQ